MADLGFQPLRMNNDVHVMKLAWQLTKDEDRLWVRVVKGKYKCGSDLIPCVTKRSSCSNMWKAIFGVWDVFKEGLTWRVGNGLCTRFWTDD